MSANMFKVIIILFLCTGIYSLAGQGNEDVINPSEVKNSESEKTPSTQTDSLNEEKSSTSGKDIPNEENKASNENINEVEPTPKPKTVTLDREQINMLAEKVIRIHGVELGTDDEENEKNIQHLRQVVSSVEKNLNEKLRLTQKKAIDKANLNSKDEVKGNAQATASDTLQYVNEPAEKNVGAASKASAPESSITTSKVDNDVTAEVPTQEEEESKTDSAEPVSSIENETQNEDTNENLETTADEEVPQTKTASDDINNEEAASDNESSVDEEINLTEDEEITTTKLEQIERPTNLTTDDNVEVTDDPVKLTQTETTESEVLQDENNSNENEDETDVEAIEEEDDESLQEDNTEDINETTSAVSAEDNDNDNERNIDEDEASEACSLNDGCDQADANNHIYSEEYNSQKINDKELESNLEDSHLQRIIKFVNLE